MQKKGSFRRFAQQITGSFATAAVSDSPYFWAFNFVLLRSRRSVMHIMQWKLPESKESGKRKTRRYSEEEEIITETGSHNRDKVKELTEKLEKVPAYKAVTVFDISQTDGEALPEIVTPLTGDVEHYEAFLESLRRSAPVPMAIEPIEDGSNGFFSLKEQRIVVRAGMSQAQTVETAIHEAAHSLVHNYAATGERAKDRSTMEMEADSIAFVVAGAFGLETGDCSFGYIASWCAEKAVDKLRASLETIVETSNRLIDDIEHNFANVCAERGIAQTQRWDETLGQAREKACALWEARKAQPHQRRTGRRSGKKRSAIER